MTKHTGNENQSYRTSDPHYITIFSRGGLIMPSKSLSNAVARALQFSTIRMPSEDQVSLQEMPELKTPREAPGY